MGTHHQSTGDRELSMQLSSPYAYTRISYNLVYSNRIRKSDSADNKTQALRFIGRAKKQENWPLKECEI